MEKFANTSSLQMILFQPLLLKSITENALYEAVAQAYIGEPEDWAASGGDVRRPASVASIFVSRIDVLIDKQLNGFADQTLAKTMRGKDGIANAKLAYARYQALFSGPRWEALAQTSARTSRRERVRAR